MPKSLLAAKIDTENSGLLRALPRLMQILRVLIRHQILGALRGKKHWPSPKQVREAFEELGLTFLKLGQVLAMRRDLLPAAYIDELELLHCVEAMANTDARLLPQSPENGCVRQSRW